MKNKKSLTRSLLGLAAVILASVAHYAAGWYLFTYVIV